MSEGKKSHLVRSLSSSERIGGREMWPLVTSQQETQWKRTREKMREGNKKSSKEKEERKRRIARRKEKSREREQKIVKSESSLSSVCLSTTLYYLSFPFSSPPLPYYLSFLLPFCSSSFSPLSSLLFSSSVSLADR